MPNEIKDKLSTSAALTITVASLADGSGRQSTLVDNATDRYQDLLVYVKLKTGTSPTGNKTCDIYLIRGDDDATTEHLSDGAGASDAAITPLNAQLIGTVKTKASPSTGDVLDGEFLVHRPGPTWGIAIVNPSAPTFLSETTSGRRYRRRVRRVGSRSQYRRSH